MTEIKKELKTRPVLYIFLGVFSAVVTFFMHNSIATIDHVRHTKKELVQYVDKRHDQVLKRLDRIENKLDTLILRRALNEGE